MSDDEHAFEGIALGRLAELGLLTATLNHELRQPLFAIKSLAQLMAAREDAPSELVELLQQVTMMEGLVDGVSTFSRHAPQTLAPLDPMAPVRQAVSLLRHRARRRRVKLVVQPVGKPPAVLGDPSAVMQACVNLIQNAIDASPTAGTVTVRVTEAAPKVLIDVMDEGSGVPEQARAQIFEPFFTTKAVGRGTGLGLAIARDLVRGCDGELKVLSPAAGAHLQISLRIVGQ